jgi:hypothetical protein
MKPPHPTFDLPMTLFLALLILLTIATMRKCTHDQVHTSPAPTPKEAPL